MATLKTVAMLLFLLVSSCVTSSGENIQPKSQSSLLTNAYEGDGDSYWRSISHFKPIQDTSYGTITIKNSFYMQFSLIWFGLSDITHNNRPYEGIFRIGTQSQSVAGCDGHATRYPALYLNREKQAIQFSISDDYDCWGVGLLNTSYHIQKNTLYTITIQYNMSWIMIQLNDKILHDDKRPGSTPLTMLSTPASVMISDSLDPAANVTLSDIIIVSYDEILTMPPTSTPEIISTHVPDITDSNMTTEKHTTNETETTHDTQAIGDADTFLVEIVINALYEETDEAHNETLNKTVIVGIVLNIFPHTNTTNITAIYASVDPNRIKVDIHTPMQDKQEVDALVAYLQYNLTADFITDMKEAYAWCDVVEVSYEVTVREIYIKHNIDSMDTNTQHIPLIGANTVIYIVIGVIVLCLCSFALLSCILCGYCRLKKKMDDMEKENQTRNNSSLSITNERNMNHICDDDANTDKIAEECQRLSQSLNGIQMSGGSVEEISLEAHIMHSSEGMQNKTQQPLYQRVATNLAQMDDDRVSSSEDELLDQLTTSNFSAKVNLSVTPNGAKHVIVPSNSDMSNYSTVNHNKLSIMIEDQMRITNQYDAEEEYDDISSATTSLSHEAMYDEGFNGLIDLVNDTNTPHTHTPHVTTPSH